MEVELVDAETPVTAAQPSRIERVEVLVERAIRDLRARRAAQIGRSSCERARMECFVPRRQGRAGAGFSPDGGSLPQALRPNRTWRAPASREGPACRGAAGT